MYCWLYVSYAKCTAGQETCGLFLFMYEYGRLIVLFATVSVLPAVSTFFCILYSSLFYCLLLYINVRLDVYTVFTYAACCFCYIVSTGDMLSVCVID